MPEYRQGAGGFERAGEKILSGFTSPLSIALTIGTFGTAGFLESAGAAALKEAGLSAAEIADVAKGSEAAAQAVKTGQGISDAVTAAGIDPNTWKKGVDLLRMARLLHAVPNVSVSSLPLVPSGKQFKLFFLDIGLLLRKSNLDYQTLYIKRELSAAFQGMLTEQFVAQQLTAQTNQKTYYWARTEAGASSEIDFVVVNNNKIVAIEVKSGKNGSLKSLHYLLNNRLIYSFDK